MPTRHLAVIGLISLAADLSSGVYASNEALITGGLCGEESEACVTPGEISDASLATAVDLPAGNTEWATGTRQKRRRRVGFSHEDVVRDESLRPFVQAFKDSLSGSEQRAGLTAEQEVSELLTGKDTSIPAEEGDEVMCATTLEKRNLSPRVVISVL